MGHTNKNGSALVKWVTLGKMGQDWLSMLNLKKCGSHFLKCVTLGKNRSHLKKWVTFGKMGQSWLNGSHLEKWVTFGKMGHNLKNCLHT